MSQQYIIVTEKERYKDRLRLIRKIPGYSYSKHTRV